MSFSIVFNKSWRINNTTQHNDTSDTNLDLTQVDTQKLPVVNKFKVNDKQTATQLEKTTFNIGFLRDTTNGQMPVVKFDLYSFICIFVF